MLCKCRELGLIPADMFLRDFFFLFKANCYRSWQTPRVPPCENGFPTRVVLVARLLVRFDFVR